MPQVDLVSVSITNVGTRATVISNIGISVGRFKGKRHGIINATKDAYFVGVPYALADGQQAHWGLTTLANHAAIALDHAGEFYRLKTRKS